jgi:hypothetical protein
VARGGLARNLVNFEAMNRFILALLFTFSGLLAWSQDTIRKSVDADPRLKTLLTKYSEINNQKHQKGYRVQIYFGADKTKANTMKARFLSQHSKEARAYEIYEVPNFKIRVGDFHTRLEAYAFLKKIKDDFPTAFIVESEIEFNGVN